MRRLLSQALSLVFLLAATSAVGAAQTVANDVVESLHDSLLAVMKDADALGFEGRRDRLAPVVAESFDMALIARGSTGRHWKTFDAEQQKRLVEKLMDLTIATYASRFDDYAGEKFRVLSQEPAPRDTVLVSTRLVKSDGEEIEINYLLRPTDAGWRIVDVYLKGVYSELAVRRSVYTSLIKRGGLKGLITAIDDKIADFKAESSD
ncbi:MAG: ABC transporter substrate-binding protein [Alphaproteobacteria bacterium]